MAVTRNLQLSDSTPFTQTGCHIFPILRHKWRVENLRFTRWKDVEISLMFVLFGAGIVFFFILAHTVYKM